MNLKDHIDREFKGNISAFAKHLGKDRMQIYRWIKNDCAWIEGAVWQKVKDQPKRKKLSFM